MNQLTKVYATLPSTAEVASDADVERHWRDNKPVKLYNGNWIKREQEGIFKLMNIRELHIIWTLSNNVVMCTTILVG